MKSFLRILTSLRTTVVLLLLTALVLLVSMLVPQAAVVGEEAFVRLVTFNPTARFFLVTLGLGRMSTSPVFFGVLVLFFTNLAAVLVARAAPTWHQIRFRPRPEAALTAWAKAEPDLSEPLPAGWSPGFVAESLRGFGYRAKKVGERAVWGVKHRTARLGFLLFHVSFFLFFAGGVLLWATRFVGSVVLTEGQEFRGEFKRVIRRPPSGSLPGLSFALASVDPRFERGEPTHLGARLVFRSAGTAVERETRINHPADWGAARVYVQQAGLSPIFWLQDGRGFTLDRVAASAVTRKDEATRVPLDSDRLLVLVEPLAAGAAVPPREDLAATAIEIEVWEDTELLFDGPLRPGEAADLGGERLVLEGIRYWAGLQVISERGGALLIAGFLIGVVGLVWRLVLHRREVAVVWDGDRFTLVGRSEYFPWRFQEELGAVFSVLGKGDDK